jgi:hypothetical protein
MRIPLLAAVLLLSAPALLSAQTAADSAAVRQAGLDYIEGWYTGDAGRMDRALHPALVKRIVETRDGAAVLDEISRDDLVEAVRLGGGSQTPAERRRAEVRILDLYGGMASVRVDAGDWVDHLHVARVDGEWKIVNVLWELRPRD